MEFYFVAKIIKKRLKQSVKKKFYVNILYFNYLKKNALHLGK